MGFRILARDVDEMNDELLAQAIVDAIYKDLRQRKLLKLLWDEDGRDAGMIAREVYPMDKEVQEDIRQRWIEIAAAEVVNFRRKA
jgi:hypothetical protein